MLSRSFTRREQWIMVGLSLAIMTGAAVILLQPGKAGEDDASLTAAVITPAAEAQAAEPSPDAAPGPAPVLEAPEALPQVMVAVRGAVRYPGMYELAEGRRVDDLLERAGGVTESADLRDINIAARLVDGTTLTVPAFPDPETGMYAEGAYPAHETRNPSLYTVAGWQAASSGSGPASGASSGGGGGGNGLIDLNRASQADLETLPGIGPVTAASIIAYREQMPFQAVEELEQVSGIGPKRLETVRDLVTVGR